MSYTRRKGLICDFPNCKSRASGGWIRRLYDRLRGSSPERLTEEAERESANWLGWTETDIPVEPPLFFQLLPEEGRTNHGHYHYCCQHEDVGL
jgi:hypothetical protein